MFRIAGEINLFHLGAGKDRKRSAFAEVTNLTVESVNSKAGIHGTREITANICLALAVAVCKADAFVVTVLASITFTVCVSKLDMVFVLLLALASA